MKMVKMIASDAKNIKRLSFNSDSSRIAMFDDEYTLRIYDMNSETHNDCLLLIKDAWDMIWYTFSSKDLL